MSFNLAEQPMERVLVIDDDVGLCELIGEYLQPEVTLSKRFITANAVSIEQFQTNTISWSST